MKLIYFMFSLILLATAATAAIVRLNEDEGNESDSIESSASVEHSSEELSSENTFKVQRRSLGLLLGTLPFLASLTRSIVPCRHSQSSRQQMRSYQQFGSQHYPTNNYNDNHNFNRNNNYNYNHNHDHYYHHHHEHGHWQYNNHPSQIPFVSTVKPTTRSTTVRGTLITAQKMTFPPITTTSTTRRPSTTTRRALTTTTTRTQRPPTTTTTTSTTPQPLTTTTSTTEPTTTTTSPSTPRYNDPDNELIYDIDLRFRV